MNSPSLVYCQSAALTCAVPPHVEKLEENGTLPPTPFELLIALLRKSFDNGWSMNSRCGRSQPPFRVRNSSMPKISGDVYLAPNCTMRQPTPDHHGEGLNMLLPSTNSFGLATFGRFSRQRPSAKPSSPSIAARPVSLEKSTLALKTMS